MRQAPDSRPVAGDVRCPKCLGWHAPCEECVKSPQAVLFRFDVQYWTYEQLDIHPTGGR